ncbi:MAG: restriction endonuclease subunit S [Bacteroidetes bacterium]|nr:restriction endonuclease subunit S [Bacteroidota bacterium]
MKFSNRLLSEVAFFQEGPGVRKFQFRNEGVKLLNVGNINKGVLDTSTTKLYISEEEAYGKYKHFLVDEGDLLIASSGIVVDNFHNKIAYVKKEHLPLCLNTSTIRFKTLDENVFSLDYLKFYLKTTHFKNQLRKLITGAAQLNFGPSHLKKITLPVPPLPDQLHIANLLRKAENLIAQRKESIRLLDEFLKSTFLEMFGNVTRNEKGFEKIKFGKVAKNENSKRVPVKQGDRDKREGIYPYYGATGVIDTIDDYKFDGEYLLIAEDGKNLLFRRKNNAFIATGKFWVNNHAHVLSYNGVCNLRYLEFFLNSIDFRPYISGIDQVKLNKENLDKIPVPVPPLTLQTQFAQIVEKTEALKTRYQQSLQELENLYGSLSQKAFRGELIKY